jgi:outer membrane protein assembly factor BamA
MRSHFKYFLLIAAAVLTLNIAALAQQNFQIAKIEFEGLNRFSVQEATATTELKVGDQFELTALDAAAQRLLDSGNFKNVAYRTRPTRDQITITFVVEEAKVTTSRVIFDNFIWFSDTELIAAVQRDVPSFTGIATDNGDMVDRITKSLQRFLHENKIEATVSYMASQDAPGSTTQEHVLSVLGIPMPICTLHFPGANNISEAKLTDSSKSLIGTDYSHKFVSLFSQNTLFPLYKELGQLRAAFSPPLAKVEESLTCKSGVDVTIPVDEGLIYKWDKAEWVGMMALTASELNDILGMTSGQPANGIKVDKASKEIQKAYGRKGYLNANLQSVPSFDDNKSIVTYRMEIREGQQFRMGQFIAKGFPEPIAKLLQERWALKPGAVFDEGYSIEFSQKQMNEIMRSLFQERRAQGRQAPNMKWNNTINRTALSVDVVLELTN